MNISDVKFPEKYIKVFDFEFGFYWMKMILPSGDLFGNKGTIWGDLGISKKFMDKKLTVSLAIDNIFDSGGFEMKRTKPIDYIPDLDGDGDPDYNFAREYSCLLYTSPSPRDRQKSRMPSSA